jgi:hypothetical protein
MELFQFLTYILAVIAGLLAGFVWWEMQGLERKLDMLRVDFRKMEAELKELKRSKK